MNHLLGELRANRLARGLAATRAFYELPRSHAEIRRLQLDAFNEIWPSISTHTPYFRELTRPGRLPKRFSSWEEFTRRTPVLDRAALSRSVVRFTSDALRADYMRTTGGSTSEPISIPASRAEDRASAHDAWAARSWYGVRPSDRLFLIWGHSHLLGQGLSGVANKWIRSLKDIACGYLRVSAYDLSDAAMRRAAFRLLAHRPAYLVGYSTALHRLAHVNRSLAPRFHALGLKVVIATAESFPTTYSAGLIEETFGCPVVMEYGAVETGILAHQRPGGCFHVFWKNYFVEGLPSGSRPEYREIAVTSLYPRVVPLVRYRLGDLVKMPESVSEHGISLASVIGRCNDEIMLSGGRIIHSEAFSHVLRDVREVQAFQVIQHGPEGISINYVADAPLSDSTIDSIHDRLLRVDGALHSTRLVQVNRLEETVAGKTKRIVNASVTR